VAFKLVLFLRRSLSGDKDKGWGEIMDKHEWFGDGLFGSLCLWAFVLTSKTFIMKDDIKRLFKTLLVPRCHVHPQRPLFGNKGQGISPS